MMRRLVTWLLIAALQLSGFGPAFAAVAPDSGKTLLGGIVSTTWANKPTSAASTQLYLMSDVGSSGTIMRYNGTRWRPLAGEAQLATLSAAVTGITNSETIVLQTLIPAGAWQTNDSILVWLATTKSGTTDTGNLSIRVGTAGTTADTAITGYSAFSIMATGSQSGAGLYEIKLASATSALKVGNAAAATHAYQSSGSSTAAVVATTITDASANALYVSIGLASSGATNTLTAQSGRIQLITP